MAGAAPVDSYIREKCAPDRQWHELLVAVEKSPLQYESMKVCTQVP